MHKKIIHHLSRIFFGFLNFLFGAIVFGLTAIALFKPQWFELFIKWMEVQINHLGNWNYGIAFTSSIIESLPIIGVLVPGQQVMLLVGGFFGKNNLAPMIALAIVGAIIGNASGYFLGKWYGDSFFEHYGDWFGLGKTELRYLRKQVEKNGAWFVILGKFHNFTRSFVPFIAGSMGMQTGNFWLYNIIGSILWATTIIVLGVAFVTYYHAILSYFPYIIAAIFASLAVYIYFFKREVFKTYLREKQQEIDEKSKN